LTTTAGFDPEGYDRPLADFLRSPAGLDLGPSSDIGHELESRGIPVETFLEAFFQGMRPYGQMLQDLLNLSAPGTGSEVRAKLGIGFSGWVERRESGS
jgi:hypothetical protein